MIDFHCHLDLFPEPERIVAAAEAARIYVLSVTTTPKAYRKTAQLANGRRYIRTALGLHPQLAHERSHELPLWEALVSETRYIGEIGLDGSPGYRKHADIQLRVFERILKVSAELGGRIMTIHSRRAASEVVDALRKHGCGETAVLHWFSGTRKQLTEAKKLGCWFSVGPAMLRSESGRKLASEMPRERVLTETDGPFAMIDDRPLMPWDVETAVKQLADLWQVDIDEADSQLTTNLKTLISQVPL